MPTEPRVYHQMLRGPRFRWWKPIVTFLLAGLMYIPLLILSFLPLLVVGLVSGTPDLESYMSGLDPKNLSPTTFVSVNLSLIVLIPVAGLSIWVVHRIRPGYLSSVAGRLRWRWLGRCVLVILPIWLVYMGLGFLVDLPSSPRPEQWLALLIITLIMTPFQSAAEEYLFRGWIMQNVGAWFRHPIVGLVVSLTVSTILFSVAHGSPDPWILGTIGCLAVASGIAAWRTGGLEAGIVMHAINNLLAFGAVLSFGGWDEAFVSVETEGTPAIFLLSVGVHAIALSLVLWQARRVGLERRYLPKLPAAPVSPTPVI
jgi:membrane protease YdiL (CAAX protease family)